MSVFSCQFLCFFTPYFFMFSDTLTFSFIFPKNVSIKSEGWLNTEIGTGLWLAILTTFLNLAENKLAFILLFSKSLDHTSLMIGAIFKYRTLKFFIWFSWEGLLFFLLNDGFYNSNGRLQNWLLSLTALRAFKPSQPLIECLFASQNLMVNEGTLIL